MDEAALLSGRPYFKANLKRLIFGNSEMSSCVSAVFDFNVCVFSYVRACVRVFASTHDLYLHKHAVLWLVAVVVVVSR